MKAMVLAAGLGQRLRPLTVYWAKPSLPLLGRPLLHYILHLLRRAGIREAVINLHHNPETITRALSDGAAGDLLIHYSPEPEILGTAGALKKAESLFGRETFLVLNGDTLADANLQAMIAWHRRKEARATLLLRPSGLDSGYTILTVDRRGRIRSAGPRAPAGAKNRRPLMFAGAWVLEPDVLDLVPAGGFARLEVDVLPTLVREGSAYGYVQDLTWIDIGTPQRYLNACLDLVRHGHFRDLWLAQEVPPPPGSSPDTVLVAGPGSTVDPSSRLSGEVVLGARCKVGPGAEIQRAVLWDDVSVGDGAVVRNAVVARGVSLAPRGRTVNKVVLRLSQGRDAFRASEIVAGHVVAPLG